MCGDALNNYFVVKTEDQNIGIWKYRLDRKSDFQKQRNTAIQTRGNFTTAKLGVLHEERQHFRRARVEFV